MCLLVLLGVSGGHQAEGLLNELLGQGEGGAVGDGESARTGILDGYPLSYRAVYDQLSPTPE